MKKIKNSLLILTLVFVVFITSACSGIQKRSMYEGNIFGIKVQVIAEHKSNKILMLESEVEIPKNISELYSGMTGKLETPEYKSIQLIMNSFNGASLKMFDGVEFNIDNIGGNFILRSSIDYRKIDKERIKEIFKIAPSETTKVMDIENFDDFSQFEKNLLEQGLTKKY